MTPEEEIAALKKSVADLTGQLQEAKKARSEAPPSSAPAYATARQVEILTAELAEAKKDLAEYRAERDERKKKAQEAPAQAPAAGKREFPFD